MAPRRPGSATSASDNSQSPPSDVPSPHFSPISIASMGLNEDGDSPGSRSARSTPSKSHLELSRSYSAGKGGCWTCRLRRKKCDEQRSGDSCRTCIRLNIDCLGWGVKRPEWMRDKQQVQAYRAKITDKLRRENRIRGQPRQPYVQAQSLPTTPTVQAPPQTNGRARPRSFVSSQGMSAPLDWSNQDSAGQLSPHIQQPNYLSSQAPSRPVSAANSPHIPGLTSLGSYPDQTLNALDLSANLPFPLISHSPISMPTEPLSNIPYTLYPMDFDYQPQNTSALQLQTQPQQSPMQQQHPESMSGQTSELVLYFFENVKTLQFKLFGDTNDVTNVIYSIIMQEPRGAVASAVCAIASLHHTKMRQATGYEALDANPEHSFNKFLYDQAFLQLVNSDSKHLRGSYSESDAIAALILTSFALLSDGWMDWAPTLQIAQDWLADTGILTDEHPRCLIASMGSGRNFAAKTTIWLDIMSSITTMQPPRFMNLYHRLFDEKAGYPLQIEQVTGFSDDVLYAIAQISTLANWKSRESINGRLSVRELIRRGDAIEQTLRRGEQEDKNATIHVNGIGLDITFSGDALRSLPSDVLTSGSAPNDDIRRIIRSLFRETAVLYLHTVLSDPNPGVQEITAGVDNVIQSLQQLPPSKLDQTLVFPTCLAGCMTDNQGQRQYLISRIQGASNVLNLQQTRSTMEGVWQRRDLLRQAGTASWEIIDWRESLRDPGMNLLLV